MPARLFVAASTRRSGAQAVSAWQHATGLRRGKGNVLVDRVCTLFDACLGNLLLYRFERDNYVATLERSVQGSRRNHQ
jgi:hypothetical protein